MVFAFAVMEVIFIGNQIQLPAWNVSVKNLKKIRGYAGLVDMKSLII